VGRWQYSLVMVTRSRSARSRGESHRVEERFRRLLSAGVAIFSQHTLPEVLQQVADAARDVVGARYAALGVLDPSGTGLAEFVTSGLEPAARARIGQLPHGHGLLGLVIRERRPIRTADLSRHPRRHGFPPHHPTMKSFLGVPITTGKTVFGNLYLTEKIGASKFDAEDEDIAILLAAQAAVAVENARLLDQVRGMQRQRDLFFAMMNHELRNALTGVYGWAERLVRRKSPESAEQAAHEVYEGTERTIMLLNNLLDLTRLDSGKVRPVWREVEPAAAVQHVLTGFGPAAEEKRISFKLEAPVGHVAFATDPVRLEQILVNLLSNAVRHSPADGCVHVALRNHGRGVQFEVRDEGPGIPHELQERIFEPFERFDPHSGIGTGLGLPVSRRLAEVLGGRLTVSSAAGEGAAFTLTLPAKPKT
jgi:signal transduction histidine kinase